MTIDCSNIHAATLSLIERCDQIRDGAVRLLTPFEYPNGAKIDVFLEAEEPLMGTYALTDLGQTTAYLLDVQVKPWATSKRRQIIEDICLTHRVDWRGGRFQIQLEANDLKDLTPAIMRLGQACIRVSDLAFSARF